MTNEIHMLSQPLLTDEGFINEACMNELEAAIEKMPPTHVRLADNREWNTPQITHYRDITAGVAYWAVKQFAGCEPTQPVPPHFAPGLENVVGFLSAVIRPKFDILGYAQISLCDVSRMLHEVLFDCDDFKAWNTSQTLGTHWLDLHALIHNVCLLIRTDRREFHEFKQRCEARHD